MIESRFVPKGAEVASFGLALLIYLLTPTSIGYQDLGALIAQQPQVAARWRQHLTASPFGTIHAAMFRLPQPVGTAMPRPPGAPIGDAIESAAARVPPPPQWPPVDDQPVTVSAGFQLASFSSRDPDVVGSIGRSPMGQRRVQPLVFPTVNRAGKGDRLMPPLPSDSVELPEKPADPLSEELEAAMRFEPFPEFDISMSLEPDPQVLQDDLTAEPEGPDMSILDQAADPDPTERTSRLFFGDRSRFSRRAIEPWAPGEEPVLMLPNAPGDRDIKQSARKPAAETGDKPEAAQEGTTIAGKGEVTGEDARPKSPAELLGLAGAARAKAEKCLANAIYFESRGEAVRGQIAVAQVVMNRVFSGYYPDSVCGVVYQNAHRHLACQFTFACDGKSKATTDDGAWERARRIARETLEGRIWLSEVGKATHYHAYWVKPRWVRTMRKLHKIGVHTFYRPRKWGDGADAPSWGNAQATAEAAAKM